MPNSPSSSSGDGISGKRDRPAATARSLARGKPRLGWLGLDLVAAGLARRVSTRAPQAGRLNTVRTQLFRDDLDAAPVAELIRPVIGVVVQFEIDSLARERGKIDLDVNPAVLGCLRADDPVVELLSVGLDDELPVAVRVVRDRQPQF